jgi:hypothetical protein
MRIGGIIRLKGKSTGSVNAAKLERARPTGCDAGTCTQSRMIRMMSAAMNA